MGMYVAQLTYDPMAGPACVRQYDNEALVLFALSCLVVAILGVLLYGHLLHGKNARKIAFAVIAVSVVYWVFGLLGGQIYLVRTLCEL